MSDDAVHQLASNILARPEYAGAVGLNAKTESWLLRWLEKLLKPFQNIQMLRDTSPLLFWIIVLAIALVCGALIAHVAWTISRALRAPEPEAASREFGGSLPDLAREAESLAQSGRYLEAAHRMMLACFRTLAERSVIELRPDRSNRWIRAALRGSTLAENLAAEIAALVERTERRWFGDRQNDPEIYARWRSAFEQLSSQAR
jgi:hypothetical protein